MESIMGGRGSLATHRGDEEQHLHAVAIADLLHSMQQELAMQALFALAELDICEERLLRAIGSHPPISSTICSSRRTGSGFAVTERPITR